MDRSQRIANNSINNMSTTIVNNNMPKSVSNINNNNNNNNIHNNATKNVMNRTRVNKESKSDLHYKPSQKVSSFNCTKNTRINNYGVVSHNSHSACASSTSSSSSSTVNRQITTNESNNNNNFIINNNRLMVSSDQLSDRTPVGSASLTPDFVEYDTPPHLRWAQQFSYLIEDTQGVDIFKSYLISEGVSDLLDFWFACEGLKKRDDTKCEDYKKLINIIFKKYILKSSIIKLSEKVKNYLVNTFKSSSGETERRYDKNIFNDAQKEVEYLLSGSIYQNFLASEIYINCLQQTQNACLGAIGGRDGFDCPTALPIDSFGASRDINVNLNRNPYLDVLPTLHEDSELQTSHSVNKSHSQQKLQRHNSVVKAINKEIPTNPNLNHLFSSIKTASLNTSKNLSPRLTTESYPNTYVSNGIYINNIDNMNMNSVNQSHQSYLRSKSMAFPPNPYHVNNHVKYHAFLPTSAQDSELQSLSSQSTNESMSCIADNSDSSLFHIQLTKKQLHQNNAFMKDNARANSSSNANNELYFHKQRSTIPDYAKDLHNPPEKFADILIKKLTELERQQQGFEKNSKVMRNILEVIASSNIDETSNHSAINTTANNNAISSSKMVITNSNINNNTNNNNVINNTNNNSNNVISNNNNNNGRSKQSVRDVVIRERLDFSATEESDQSILDRHFEQVFSETPNDTPEHNFGFVSPPKMRAPYDNNSSSLSKHMQSVSNSVSSSSQSTNYFVDSYVPSIPVIFKYATEEYPYKLSIKDRNITLGKFKQLLPAKKGHWQYFFKRICDDSERNHLEHEFVNENISDDNQLLPLCDGKIFATIEQIAGNDCQH